MDWKISPSGVVTAYIGYAKEAELPLSDQKGNQICEVKKVKHTDKSYNSLEKLIIPEGYKRIADWTFEDCTQLREVIIPTTIDRIGENTFKGCISLEQIVFMGRVVIEQNAFRECQNLKDVYIVNPRSFVGSRAFTKCPNYNVHLHPDSLSIDDIPKKRCVLLNTDELREYAKILFQEPRHALGVTENDFWSEGDELEYKLEKEQMNSYYDTYKYVAKVVNKLNGKEALLKEKRQLEKGESALSLPEHTLCNGLQDFLYFRIIQDTKRASASAKYCITELEIGLREP